MLNRSCLAVSCTVFTWRQHIHTLYRVECPPSTKLLWGSRHKVLYIMSPAALQLYDDHLANTRWMKHILTKNSARPRWAGCVETIDRGQTGETIVLLSGYTHTNKTKNPVPKNTRQSNSRFVVKATSSVSSSITGSRACRWLAVHRQMAVLQCHYARAAASAG
jgi:hypothetical protein